MPGEGVIFYDIRLTAYIRESEIKILINIEAQRTTNAEKLQYHLENRMIFYLARMISVQKQTEFFHSDYDSLKKVRSIWICMDSEEEEGSIEELGFERAVVFGSRKNAYDPDLMRGVVVSIRSGKNLKKSQNMLIAMLEELISKKDAEEKKRILSDEYGMIMNAELEGRINTMCNWSIAIAERERKDAVETERLDAIGRMIKAGAQKEQILLYGYTEEEVSKVEASLLATV